jgi:pyrimidine-nucleoside phosphorylase
MRVVDLIAQKRNGNPLTTEQIRFLVDGYVRGNIPDYQISALLMAVFFRSMNHEETVALTRAIVDSGVTLDFSDLDGPVIDKHSTGGVGDKTSIIIAPLVAACGVFVPMISGRGLGHTGGTLDKLESIPGFKVNLALNEFKTIVRRTGAALIGQTAELAPGDKKLYALRDVTSTVESIPLIVASIISKKVAEGIDGLVLDVKTGSGAFMKTLEDSRALARALVSTGRLLGMKVTALITNMEEPLGHAVGNSAEIVECVEILKGGGPEDLKTVSLALAAEMLVLAGLASSAEQALDLLERRIVSGEALDKLREIIRAQGGKAEIVEEDLHLPQASHRHELRAPRKGYVRRVQAEPIGKAAMLLGAGRETVDSVIDHAAAVWVRRKRGEQVDAGDPLCTLEFNDSRRLEEAISLAAAAFEIGEAPPSKLNLVLERISQ